jgi:hypothetical protein
MYGKILIIDNLYVSHLKNKVGNGAQLFAENQVKLLKKLGDIHFITASGSDNITKNQYILSKKFNLDKEKSEKIKETKEISIEISEIIKLVQPDIILDNCCKHLSSIWKLYNNGYIFEHYHRPSFPLGIDTRKKFEKYNVKWIGVSNWQNKKFNNYFDDTINIHYIEEQPSVKEAEEYGIFIGRWDPGKSPHIILKNYIKSNSRYPIKCFIKGDLNDPSLKDLMKEPLLQFYIDYPREQIFKHVSKAMFGLGMGHESTGIVSLEYVSHGVPYIVIGTDKVAEEEHLPKDAIYLINRSSDKSIPKQISEAVTDIERWTKINRLSISNYVALKYTEEHFINEHKRIIKTKGKGLYDFI